MNVENIKNFTKDIDYIREYISYIGLVNDIQNSTSQDSSLLSLKQHLHNFGVHKKIFEYKSITISLYGILENHIGIWVKEYIEKIQVTVKSYNDLPSKFRDLHFNLSVKLLGLISEKKHAKYENLNKDKVLEKLSICIQNPSNFQLNKDAFYLQSGNLKHAKISEIFNNLDIKLTENLKTIGSRTPDGFLCNVRHIENKGDDLFTLIDDLVTRRNDIAHGENIDEILSITEFNEYITFLENYGKAIFQILLEKTIELESQHLYQEINILKIFSQGTVICFEINNYEIYVGDVIIIKLLDGGFIKSKIDEIQVDGVYFNYFHTDEPRNIGIKISESISKSQICFIKQKDESLLNRNTNLPLKLRNQSVSTR